jgi:hypothetical protein
MMSPPVQVDRAAAEFDEADVAADVLDHRDHRVLLSSFASGTGFNNITELKVAAVQRGAIRQMIGVGLAQVAGIWATRANIRR